MPLTLLLLHPDQARRHWQRLSPEQRGQAVCLLLASDAPMEALARSWGIPLWQPAPFSPERQEQHLTEYLALMDGLAVANGENPLWWSTHLSRKNVTSSPLPELLLALAHALEAHARARREGRLLLLLAPPWPLVAALLAPSQAGAFLCPGGLARHRWRYRWRGQWAAWRELGRDLFATLRRLLLARRHGPRAPQQDDAPRTLIKSFAYARSFTDAGFRDPFFGPLADYLQGQGEHPLTAVIASEQPGLCFRHMGVLPRQDVLPFEGYLSAGEAVGEVWKILSRPALTRFQAPDSAPFLGCSCTPLLEEVLAAGGWRFSLYQHLHFHGGRRLAQRHPLKAVLFPWEGNPWERRFIAGIREGAPGVPVVGVQHAVVSREHAGAFITEVERRMAPTPDHLLATGPATAALFTRYGVVPVTVACALRQAGTPPAPPEISPPALPMVVLVPLEGLWEVLPLVAYVLEQASALPHVRFRFRAHPVLPLERLLERLGRSLPPGGNIERSSVPTVAEDLALCGVVLYSRTTVALEALAQGKPLIHFDSGGLFGEDPLFQLTACKWTVNRATPLGGVLEAILAVPEGEWRESFSRARGFLEGYFYPATPEHLAPFLPRNLASPGGLPGCRASAGRTGPG